MPTAQATMPTATFTTVTSEVIQNAGIIDVKPLDLPTRSGGKAYRVTYRPAGGLMSQSVAIVDETNRQAILTELKKFHQAQQEQLELAKLNAEADAHQ